MSMEKGTVRVWVRAAVLGVFCIVLTSPAFVTQSQAADAAGPSAGC